MAPREHVSALAVLSLGAVLIFPCASAWSNGGYSSDPGNPDFGTHDWIANTALTIQTRDVTFLASTYHIEFLLGTEAPDNPDYIGDTFEHHVYYYADGQVQDDSCAQRASQVYQTALVYLNEGDFHSAAYDIGVLAHYVADVGVFGHTMGAYTAWGAETHHSDYEDEVNARVGSLSLPPGTALGDSSAYMATMDLAEVITFGGGPVKSNVWMNASYDWESTEFVSSATASVYASVSAVAAVINHLMIESEQPTAPPTHPETPGFSVTLLAIIVASVSATVGIGYAVLRKRPKA